jgi:hypothetical protein
MQGKLAAAQRSKDSKKKGSKNWAKARIKEAKISKRVIAPRPKDRGFHGFLRRQIAIPI